MDRKRAAFCPSICPGIECEGSAEVLEFAGKKGVNTYIERLNNRGLDRCQFGAGGTCCRNCSMGPCMMIEGVADSIGICGATAATTAARNFGRMIAAGSAAHIDHARETVMGFLASAKGEAPYSLKDGKKLLSTARFFEIKTDSRSIKDIAIELGEKALAEFGRQEGGLRFIKRAPAKRQEIWKKLGVLPRGIDREVTEMMHRTHMGTDQDYENLILQGTRCALADGWGASMISTELQDIMFGTPVPIRATVNLGVLRDDAVNVVVHGHEPLLSEALAMVVEEPEIIAAAQAVGAKGVQLSGVCCTGNEVLMRHGIPIAGSFIQQEIVLATGAVEVMVVDIQCVMQSLPTVAQCYHTEIITTSSRAKIAGATHIDFDHHHALDKAREIVKRAISRYPQRGAVHIPRHKMDVVAGFSHETINHMLGGRFRGSYRPLNDNIINGRIRGVAAVVGCDTARVRSGLVHTSLVKELIANNILVLVTGCAATACGRDGLLTPEAGSQAGPGLREVCETVGIPPVLHMGSCVDNSRILVAASEIVREGGLGEDISQIPAVGCAPEWMSEKAIAIGQYCVASGASVIFGQTFPTLKSQTVTNHLFKGLQDVYGAIWGMAEKPHDIAKWMIEAIDLRRENLGIHKKKERVLFDMAMRREL